MNDLTWLWVTNIGVSEQRTSIAFLYYQPSKRSQIWFSYLGIQLYRICFLKFFSTSIISLAPSITHIWLIRCLIVLSSVFKKANFLLLGCSTACSISSPSRSVTRMCFSGQDGDLLQELIDHIIWSSCWWKKMAWWWLHHFRWLPLLRAFSWQCRSRRCTCNRTPLVFKLRTFLVLLKVKTCCEIRRRRSIASTSGS